MDFFLTYLTLSKNNLWKQTHFWKSRKEKEKFHTQTLPLRNSLKSWQIGKYGLLKSELLKKNIYLKITFSFIQPTFVNEIPLCSQQQRLNTLSDGLHLHKNGRRGPSLLQRHLNPSNIEDPSSKPQCTQKILKKIGRNIIKKYKE